MTDDRQAKIANICSARNGEGIPVFPDFIGVSSGMPERTCKCRPVGIRRGPVVSEGVMYIIPKIKVPEKDVLKACLDFLNGLPYVVAWRQNSGAYKGEYNGKKRFVRFGQPGSADITGMVNGVRLECETKATGEKPTESQEAWMKFIGDNGGIAFWCDSVDMCAMNMRRIFEERGLNWKKEWSL